MVVKPTVKKDTVRIEVPSSRVAPQATVKIQQTQPLIRPPEAQVRTLARTDVDVVPEIVAGKEDPMLMAFSLCVLVFAAISCAIEAITYFTY